MSRRWAALAVIAFASLAGAPAAFADSTQSSNWAGYAVHRSGVHFTRVAGTWTQPKATCTRGQSTYSSMWVGVGGYDLSSQALEQIGTESNCDARGRPVYAAWYELVPAPSIPIRMTILPGDRISAAVVAQGTEVTLQLTNATRHVRVTRRVTVPEPDLTSAEWIAEAPSSCSPSGRCTGLPLANFGSVSFARAAATGDAHAGTIADPAWQANVVELAELPQDGLDPRFTGRQPAPGSGASPGPLSADGRGFAVAWHPATS